jgi:hypothetical protein
MMLMSGGVFWVSRAQTVKGQFFCIRTGKWYLYDARVSVEDSGEKVFLRRQL